MSSDSNVFVDLTFSPGSSPRSAVRGGPATVSTIELADPSLDLAGVRASLSALQQSIGPVEALRELRLAQSVLTPPGFARPASRRCPPSSEPTRTVSRSGEETRSEPWRRTLRGSGSLPALAWIDYKCYQV
ncbi:hypothetical protein F441_01569 [Phytophthora nicotianae CJ01A1]|uniref:Uncharacterized protein n=1 Tax=Phytophthora nicotianae CJ01A1 TaxID=1317063 RepID=W2XRS4_PHYNI|nr:hypothetical protein F441_01569 [Phytophthora nicotianae CJ01A1]